MNLIAVGRHLLKIRNFAILIVVLIFVTVICNSAYASVSYHIPEWMKVIAGWYATSQISDSEFTQAVQYMVNQGIIKVQSNDTTVTNSTIVGIIVNHLESQNNATVPKINGSYSQLTSTPTTNSEQATTSIDVNVCRTDPNTKVTSCGIEHITDPVKVETWLWITGKINGTIWLSKMQNMIDNGTLQIPPVNGTVATYNPYHSIPEGSSDFMDQWITQSDQSKFNYVMQSLILNGILREQSAASQPTPSIEDTILSMKDFQLIQTLDNYWHTGIITESQYTDEIEKALNDGRLGNRDINFMIYEQGKPAMNTLDKLLAEGKLDGVQQLEVLALHFDHQEMSQTEFLQKVQNLINTNSIPYPPMPANYNATGQTRYYPNGTYAHSYAGNIIRWFENYTNAQNGYDVGVGGLLNDGYLLYPGQPTPRMWNPPIPTAPPLGANSIQLKSLIVSWNEGKLNDTQWLSQVQLLIDNKTIMVPNLPNSSAGETLSPILPEWIKTELTMWASTGNSYNYQTPMSYLVNVGYLKPNLLNATS